MNFEPSARMKWNRALPLSWRAFRRMRRDSVNAISWVKQKKCKTKLPRDPKTEQLFQLIERAEKWLRENTYSTPILKWETQQWGEIPADFGRK